MFLGFWVTVAPNLAGAAGPGLGLGISGKIGLGISGKIRGTGSVIIADFQVAALQYGLRLAGAIAFSRSN
jgi:hypothetical protein